jgi:tripartite-type tricarboxylate transporter receptor subunit TctC
MRLTAKIAVGFFAAACAVPSGPAVAQNNAVYPSRPIHLIIGYGSGGMTDVVNRIMADDMGRKLGQSVIVENRPGAGGVIAATAVKNAAPDGYTLFSGEATSMSPLMVKASLDAPRELTPIGTFASGSWFLYASSKLGVNSLKDLTAYAKANPGQLRFSTINPVNTLIFALTAKKLGIQYETIPYKTTDQTVLAMLSGDAGVTIGAASGYDSEIQSGKVKVLTAYSPERNPLRPEVATAREQGVDMVMRFSVVFWGPLGLQPAVLDRLQSAIRESVKAPLVVERMHAASLVPGYASPEDTLREYNNVLATYREAIPLINYQPQ